MYRLLIYAAIGVSLFLTATMLLKVSPKYQVSANRNDSGQLQLRIFERLPFGSNQTVARPTINAAVVSDVTNLRQGEAFILEVEFSSPDQSGLVSQTIARSQVRFNLAGATVAPEDPQPLGPDLKATWSILIDNAGRTSGFIDFTPPRSLEGRMRTELRDNRLNFQIESNATPPTFIERYAQPAGVLLGLIIAFTNIIRFIWAGLDRGAKNQEKERIRQQEEQAKRKRLILPKDFK